MVYLCDWDWGIFYFCSDDASPPLASICVFFVSSYLRGWVFLLFTMLGRSVFLFRNDTFTLLETSFHYFFLSFCVPSFTFLMIRWPSAFWQPEFSFLF